jgi:hypothetical protein
MGTVPRQESVSNSRKFYMVPLLKICPQKNAVKIGKWSGKVMVGTFASQLLGRSHPSRSCRK